MDSSSIISFEDVVDEMFGDVPDVRIRSARIRLLTDAFLASLHLDEGRPIRVALLLRLIESDIVINYTHFRDAVDLSPLTIKTLAAAISPEQGSLVVERRSDERLVVAGVSFVPPFNLNAWGLPPPTTVIVDGPGRLKVQSGKNRWVWDRGSFTRLDRPQWPVWTKFIDGRIVSAIEKPLDQGHAVHAGGHGWPVDQVMWQNHRMEFMNIVRDYVRFLVPSVLRTLCKKICLLRHGGAFIIGPDFMDVATTGGSWFRDYGYEHLSTFSLNVVWLHSNLQFADAGKRIVTENVVSSFSDPSWQAHLTSQHNVASVGLSESIQEVAQLTAIDGAVVVDEALAVRAFGVKFMADRDVEFPGIVDSFLSTRGTRHRSMASAVAKCGNPSVPHVDVCVLGFVVSQDGHVTAFHKKANAALEFEEVDL